MMTQFLFCSLPCGLPVSKLPYVTEEVFSIRIVENLYHNLTSHLDYRTFRPVAQLGEVTDVYFHLTLTKIISVDTRTSEMVSSVWLQEVYRIVDLRNVR